MEQRYLTDTNVVIDYLNNKIDEPIILRGIEIRKKVRIKLPDAIIAATALVLDLTLMTRNIGDFKNINGLKLINPWDL